MKTQFIVLAALFAAVNKVEAVELTKHHKHHHKHPKGAALVQDAPAEKPK